MKNNFLSKLKNWILRFVQVQLIVSLISLPILASWGLPISILSPIGNILFTPIFMLFLFISSILFFCEICFIPNGLLVYLLDKISCIWLYCMPSNNHTPFIGFTKPHVLFVILLPIVTFSLLFFSKIKNITMNILCLFLLLLASFAYLKVIQAPKTIVKQVPCHNGTITLIYNKGKTCIIDPGYIGSRISANSWVQYTLIPEIIKTCGKTEIDYLILMAPGKILFEAVEKLCESIQVKNIYLICWDGKLQKNIIKSFFSMKRSAIKNNTIIKRFFKKKKIINFTDNTSISIVPFDKNLTYQEVTYPAICITYTIDNQMLNIYSAKYKEKE